MVYTHDRGYSRVSEFQLELKEHSSRSFLKAEALLGHPRLRDPEVRSADRVLYWTQLQFMAEQKLTKPTYKEFVRIRFSEDIYRALWTARRSFKFPPNARVRRLWRQIPKLCLMFPVRMNELAACLADDLRVYGITGKRTVRPHILWEIFRPRCRYDGLQGGHLKRALPAPLRVNAENLLRDFRERLTVPSNCPEEGEFCEWITQWVDFYRPRVQPSCFDVDITHNACLEIKRGVNGMAGAASFVPCIQSYAENGPYAGWYRYMISAEAKTKYSTIPIGKDVLADFLNTTKLIAGSLNLFSPFIEHRKVCQTATCTASGLHPRVCPLVIFEKGNKTRIPTMTSVVEQVLASIYRSAVSHWMVNDPRIASSMRGFLRIPKPKVLREDWLWRSQDLTTATDDHDFVTTAFLYKEIGRHLKVPSWWGSVIDTICGPHEIISYEQCKRIRDWHEARWLPAVADGLPWVYPDWRQDRYGQGLITRRGQFMGTATSWPKLPLVTLYAFEKSSAAPMRTLRRRVTAYQGGKLANCTNIREFLALTGEEPAYVELTRRAPKGAYLVDTTGDDCIALMDRAHSERHSYRLSQIGGVVSLKKDFLDPHYGIYTEVLLKDGVPMGVMPLGVMCASQGTRSPGWYDASMAFTAVAQKHEVSTRRVHYVWPLCRFYAVHKALAKKGFPVQFPPQMGGLQSLCSARPNAKTFGPVNRLARMGREDLERCFGVRPFPHELLIGLYRPKATTFDFRTTDAGAISRLQASLRKPQESTVDTRALQNVWQAEAKRTGTLVLTQKQVGELYSRVLRWGQFFESKDVSPRLEDVTVYMASATYSRQPCGDPMATYRRCERKVSRLIVVPWDTLCALAGPRVTLGPLGPSNPTVVVNHEYQTQVWSVADPTA